MRRVAKAPSRRTAIFDARPLRSSAAIRDEGRGCCEGRCWQKKICNATGTGSAHPGVSRRLRHASCISCSAPAANLTNGGHAATAAADGVAITVSTNDRSGRPHDLYRLVTPLKVRIENNSKKPLRIAYEDFDLQTPQGRTLAALPPSQITGQQYGEDIQQPSPYEGEDSAMAARPRVVEAAWQEQDRGRDQHGQRHSRHFEHRRNHGRTVFITPGFDWGDFYYAPTTPTIRTCGLSACRHNRC
jgi:hypothetical protein